MRLYLICECCCEPQSDEKDREKEDERFIIDGQEGAKWVVKVSREALARRARHNPPVSQVVPAERAPPPPPPP